MNLSEALGWMKTLKQRHLELVGLRDSNSHRTVDRWRAPYEKNETQQTTEPTYDVKKLDKRITLIAREIRVLDEAIKRTNATVEITNYTRDDAVLGELED